MFCSNCGAKIQEEANFCENCGTKIDNSYLKECQYNYVWKNCGTCMYWTGPRTINNFRTVVSISDVSVKGECVGGGRNRTMMAAGSTCTSYEKWPLLKI